MFSDESINKVEESNSQNSIILPEVTSKQEDTHKYVLHLLNEEVVKLPENEHAKQSPVLETTENNHCSLNGSNLKSQEMSTLLETSDDSLSDMPNNGEDSDSCDDDESSAEVLLSSSKVSVIPHDLFYYPHYNVPISAVLDAYVEPCLKRYDTENDISFSETVTDSLHEEGAPAQDYKEDAPEPGLQNNHGVPSLEMGTENGEEETIDMNSHSTSFYEKEVPLLIGEIEIEIDSQKATGNEDSMILQHPEVLNFY